METGVIRRLDGDPGIQIVPALGLKVSKYYLHSAIWIPRAVSMGEVIIKHRCCKDSSSEVLPNCERARCNPKP